MEPNWRGLWLTLCSGRNDMKVAEAFPHRIDPQFLLSLLQRCKFRFQFLVVWLLIQRFLNNKNSPTQGKHLVGQSARNLAVRPARNVVVPANALQRCCGQPQFLGNSFQRFVKVRGEALKGEVLARHHPFGVLCAKFMCDAARARLSALLGDRPE